MFCVGALIGPTAGTASAMSYSMREIVHIQ
jgi:hypothetical protein